MDYKNDLLDQWLGGPIWVMHLKGPEPDSADLLRMVEDPKTTTDVSLQSRIALYELLAYDRVGVTLRGLYENAPAFFAPWGTVIRIQGRDEDQTAGVEDTV